MPVCVLERDETVMELSSITKGTNGFLIGPILGYTQSRPFSGTSVRVNDVAKIYVLALDAKIEGNQDFLAAGPDFR
jgi:hypothetical protein